MGLEIVELIMKVEETFGIAIPDAEASGLTTPRHVVDYVFGRVEDRGMTREQVADIVRQVIVEQTGIKNFSDADEFVSDMHLD